MVKSAPRRCGWCTGDALYQIYHDDEWGVPVHDDRVLFKRLILEGMQAGLSWLTVLKKRAHMMQAFFEFDPERLAKATDAQYQSWLADAGLIRNRAKLRSITQNARAFLELQSQRTFSSYVWDFVDGETVLNQWRRRSDVPSQTPTSVAMSKALKKSGFNFVGPTICYAFMQSAGLVNDHETRCFRHAELSG